tara:strand:- start:89 stop:331 length:243 start_codon:yes stop_codon:yes gene_type:complete
MKIADINEITMYTKTVCPYCVRAKNLLKSKGLEWSELNIETPEIRESFMEQFPTVRTVPQILINGERIGGYQELEALGLE